MKKNSIQNDPLENNEQNGAPKIARKVVICFSAVLILVILVGILLANSYMGKVQYVSVDQYDIEPLVDENAEEVDTSIPDSPDNQVEQLEENIASNNTEDSNTDVLPGMENVTNILIIGCDTRDKGGNGRSDSMILVSINKETKKLIATSFLRDIYLKIPGLSQGNRLNAAYAYGGAGLLKDTIEQNFNIPIDYYVSVDFFSFMKVVDLVGGVQLEVSSSEIKVMNNYISELNHLLKLPDADGKLTDADAGDLLMNGKQALAFSRVRYVGNADFERTSRQRRVLEKVFSNLKSLKITQLHTLLNSVLPEITTDIPDNERWSLVLSIPALQNYEIEQWSIPYNNKHDSLRIRGMQVLGIDFKENKKQLQDKIYGK